MARTAGVAIATSPIQLGMNKAIFIGNTVGPACRAGPQNNLRVHHNHTAGFVSPAYCDFLPASPQVPLGKRDLLGPTRPSVFRSAALSKIRHEKRPGESGRRTTPPTPLQPPLPGDSPTPLP